ncbi:hypothetical protein V8F20_004218 [Naviculisporaceae sp. PSN 640]
MSDSFPFRRLPLELRMMTYDFFVPKGTVVAFVPGRGWVCRGCLPPGEDPHEEDPAGEEAAGEKGPDRRAPGANLRTLLSLSRTCSSFLHEVNKELFGRVVFHLKMELQPVPGVPGGRVMMSSCWPLPPVAASVLPRIRELVWRISQEDLAALSVGMLASEEFGQLLQSLERLTVVRSADLVQWEDVGRYVHVETLGQVVRAMMERKNGRPIWQPGVPVVLAGELLRPRSFVGAVDDGPSQAEYLEEAEAALGSRPGWAVEFKDDICTIFRDTAWEQAEESGEWRESNLSFSVPPPSNVVGIVNGKCAETIGEMPKPHHSSFAMNTVRSRVHGLTKLFHGYNLFGYPQANGWRSYCSKTRADHGDDPKNARLGALRNEHGRDYHKWNFTKPTDQYLCLGPMNRHLLLRSWFKLKARTLALSRPEEGEEGEEEEKALEVKDQITPDVLGGCQLEGPQVVKTQFLRGLSLGGRSTDQAEGRMFSYAARSQSLTSPGLSTRLGHDGCPYPSEEFGSPPSRPQFQPGLVNTPTVTSSHSVDWRSWPNSSEASMPRNNSNLKPVLRMLRIALEYPAAPATHLTLPWPAQPVLALRCRPRPTNAHPYWRTLRGSLASPTASAITTAPPSGPSGGYGDRNEGDGRRAGPSGGYGREGEVGGNCDRNPRQSGSNIEQWAPRSSGGGTSGGALGCSRGNTGPGRQGHDGESVDSLAMVVVTVVDATTIDQPVTILGSADTRAANTKTLTSSAVTEQDIMRICVLSRAVSENRQNVVAHFESEPACFGRAQGAVAPASPLMGVAQPVQTSSSKNDDEVKDRAFAQQLTSVKQGTNLNAPKKNEEEGRRRP